VTRTYGLVDHHPRSKLLSKIITSPDSAWLRSKVKIVVNDFSVAQYCLNRYSFLVSRTVGRRKKGAKRAIARAPSGVRSVGRSWHVCRVGISKSDTHLSKNVRTSTTAFAARPGLVLSREHTWQHARPSNRAIRLKGRALLHVLSALFAPSKQSATLEKLYRFRQYLSYGKVVYHYSPLNVTSAVLAT